LIEGGSTHWMHWPGSNGYAHRVTLSSFHSSPSTSFSIRVDFAMNCIHLFFHIFVMWENIPFWCPSSSSTRISIDRHATCHMVSFVLSDAGEWIGQLG